MSANSHLKGKTKLTADVADEYDIIQGDETDILLDSNSLYSYNSLEKPTDVTPFTVRHWTYRYTILLLISLIQLSLNFSLDVPAGLESILIDTMGVGVSSYAMLYSVYSWPSVVLTVLGAILVNKFIGCRCATVLFMTILCIGQAVFAVGAFYGLFWVLMMARFVLGVGGEIAFITTDAFAAHWFKGREVPIAFGIIGAFCRIGGASGLYVNNIIYNLCDSITDGYFRLGVTLLFTVTVLLIATLFSLILAVMDKHAENTITNVKDRRLSLRKFSVKDMLKFNTNFWILSAICILYFSTIFPFVAIAQMFLGSKYGLSISDANTADLLIFLIPIGAPLFGVLINWIGFNIYWSLLGIIVAFSAHFLYLISNGAWFVPYVANSVLGLSFGCVNTALWAAPPLLVLDYQLMTAYGVLEAGSNLGFAITDIISGQLIDNFGYFVHQLFFLYLLVISIFLTVLLLFNLLGTDCCVNKPGWKIRRQKNVKKLLFPTDVN